MLTKTFEQIQAQGIHCSSRMLQYLLITTFEILTRSVSKKPWNSFNFQTYYNTCILIHEFLKIMLCGVSGQAKQFTIYQVNLKLLS